MLASALSALDAFIMVTRDMTNHVTLRWYRLSETFDGAPVDRLQTYRAEVPGGWLVVVCTGKPGKGDVGGLAFVADEAHLWKLPESPSGLQDLEKPEPPRPLGKGKRKHKHGKRKPRSRSE